ncbi:Paired amphipathic helix protein Sin3-like 4 [Rhynchospora pubera]|uniref:Paired amphipathic helix protein Sin3-like 4 n=1 Tax=Rhynchospora pubera TaxID=906938 RepID=A0AAV8ETM7_9POAL|nr:Paired amphipathic helix protein Sin3-like 4 [Rhynchospora pubera]
MRGYIFKWGPVTFEESLGFVKKVKLFMLLRNHEDLREELERFRPCRQRGLYSPNSFWMSILLLPLVLLSVLLAFDKPFSYLQQVAN